MHANIAKTLILVLFGTAAMSAPTVSGQQRKPTTVTITEPGRFKLEEFFQKADVVALVKILSGDAEHYSAAVYKTTVVESFKGTARGEILYFGPYSGERLGAEYIVFLHSQNERMTPKREPTIGYGSVKYHEILNQGYGALETSYECVLTGREIYEQCDYSVRIFTDYLQLPNSTVL